MRRIGIYVIYDKDDIVDDYIGYMLKQLKTVVDALYVVVNGTRILRGRENLCFATKVFFRENQGYDVGAFKDALENLIGWDVVGRYDEIVLINDSFFGPFCSFQTVFSEMQSKPCDFWGASIYAESEYYGNVIKEHVQSFFMVIRSRLLHAEEYRYFWKNLPTINGIGTAIKYYETSFTEYFANLGYIYDCLADMIPNNARENREMNYTQYGYLQYELIKKRKFPFLKRKPISLDYLGVQTQEQWKLALDYIKNRTEYDVSMIYQNLIRICNHTDLYQKLQLQFILNTGERFVEPNRNAAVIVNVTMLDSMEYICEYLERIKDVIDIIICVRDMDIYNAFVAKKYQVYFWSEMKKLIEKKEYLYYCLIEDNDITSSNQFSCVGKSLLYNVWENLLCDGTYVNNVIDMLEKNKEIGILTHPVPVHAQYFGKYMRYWGSEYSEIKGWLQDNAINCIISKDKIPVVKTNNFWIRSEIIKEAIKYNIDKFPYYSFLWSFIAQERGFLSGVIETREYAEMSQINQQVYLNKFEQFAIKHVGGEDSFESLMKNMNRDAIHHFTEKFKNIYIYGTGYMAQQYKGIVGDICGYIVSDGQPIQDAETTFYLSQIEPNEDIGIIVCLNEEHQSQIMPVLARKGFHYYCI